MVGDITTIPADAIGNAANAALAGGGAVGGAIHAAGGPAIMAELRTRYPGGTPTGTAVATGAGELPARWVIHAVGPVCPAAAGAKPTQCHGRGRDYPRGCLVHQPDEPEARSQLLAADKEKSRLVSDPRRGAAERSDRRRGMPCDLALDITNRRTQARVLRAAPVSPVRRI
jgi:hypothetical protein